MDMIPIGGKERTETRGQVGESLRSLPRTAARQLCPTLP
jgi:hypothetical protein